jgi:hypothetical protein
LRRRTVFQVARRHAKRGGGARLLDGHGSAGRECPAETQQEEQVAAIVDDGDGASCIEAPRLSLRGAGDHPRAVERQDAFPFSRPHSAPDPLAGIITIRKPANSLVKHAMICTPLE